jgi:hypothetical protein
VALHLRGEVREVFMSWLKAQRPDLVPRYEELYRRRAYAPQEERERLAAMVRRRGTSSGVRQFGSASRPAARAQSSIRRSRQQALF